MAPTLHFWFPQLPLTSVKLNIHSPCLLVFRRGELIWSFPVFGRTTQSSSPATVSPSRPKTGNVIEEMCNIHKQVSEDFEVLLKNKMKEIGIEEGN